MNCFLCPYRRVKFRVRLAERHISKGTNFPVFLQILFVEKF